MTRNVQMALQIVAGCGQVILPTIPGITPEWLKFGHAILAACSTAIAVIGHYYNPDGTPAEVSYQKTTKP